MCLLTKLHNHLVASEDITCYKILRKTEDGYFSPCMSLYQWKPFGELNTPVQSGAHMLPMYWEGFHRLDVGWLHTYRNIQNAKFTQKVLNGRKGFCGNERHATNVIVRCRIPKGTLYFSGTTIVEEMFAFSYYSRELV